MSEPSTPAGEVPAPIPAPAGGVEVLGPLAGSGYRIPPVLVRRGDGQMLQLTPLLAAVVEAVDGRRDHAAIAAHVAARLGRHLHPDDVAALVDRLLPLGLVRVPGVAEAVLRRADPLLGLRGRVGVVSPARTRALTRPFLWLFRPGVVIAVLAAFASSSAWVLARHGLGTAVEEAVADPALLLGIVALVLASGAFHELGHATACRYGGAAPGGMGAALYLVWPAFYTDVTDSYRLDRRGRLRVDLGGLYFNAVFSVATVAFALVSGVEALLVLVPVQLLQMARQLVPLVRFDGYHVLADLVGVPDLFARIRPTLRRVLPRHRRAGPSPLTRRTQAVVVAWVAAVVPVLVASLGMLLWHLPGIVSASLRTLRLQGGLLARNVEAGHVAAALLGVVAMATVALLPASAAYLTSRIAHRTGQRWWRLTDGRPVLRSAPAVVAVVALLAAGPGLLPGPDRAPAERAGQVTEGQLAAAPAPTVPTSTSEPSPGPVRPSAPAAVPVAAQVEVADVPMARASPEPVATEEPAPLAPPTLRPAWPFAFDPPAVPGAGDNQALAVGTVDGATRVAWATSLQLLHDQPMANRNEAWALAECVGCRTLAVAFQIVAASGEVATAVPENRAVAYSEDCQACRTTAVAVQLAVTLDETPPSAVQAQLRRVVARVEGLQGTLRDASPGAIRTALLEAKAEALALLEPFLAEVPAPEDPTVGDVAAAEPEAPAMQEEGPQPVEPVEQSLVPSPEVSAATDGTEAASAEPADGSDGAGEGPVDESGSDSPVDGGEDVGEAPADTAPEPAAEDETDDAVPAGSEEPAGAGAA